MVQIMRQYQKKEEQIRNSELFYVEYSKLRGYIQHIDDIKTLVSLEQYDHAIEQCERQIKDLLEGLRYLQTYVLFLSSQPR